MAASTRVALVCDADDHLGLGHLSRCIALGEALVDAGAEAVVVGRGAEAASALLAGSGASSGITTLPCALPLGAPGAVDERHRALDELGAAALVVDSYAVGPDDLETLAAGRTAACIDDFARLERYPVDLVINFTVGAVDLAYPEHPGLLLGPRWFLARRALRQRRGQQARTAAGPVHRVLVAIGGADRSGTTRRVVRSIAGWAQPPALHVVSGRPLPDHDEATIDAALAAIPGSARSVALPSLADAIAEADLVVCGGGLTKYEAAYLGVPAAVIDQTTDQAEETRRFAGLGLARSLGPWDLGDDELGRALEAVADDGPGRLALADAGHRAFPDDPTAAVAAQVLARC